MLEKIDYYVQKMTGGKFCLNRDRVKEIKVREIKSKGFIGRNARWIILSGSVMLFFYTVGFGLAALHDKHWVLLSGETILEIPWIGVLLAMAIMTVAWLNDVGMNTREIYDRLVYAEFDRDRMNTRIDDLEYQAERAVTDGDSGRNR